MDALIIFVLAAFDRFMDWITRGTWSDVRGSEIRIVE